MAPGMDMSSMCAIIFLEGITRTLESTKHYFMPEDEKKKKKREKKRKKKEKRNVCMRDFNKEQNSTKRLENIVHGS